MGFSWESKHDRMAREAQPCVIRTIMDSDSPMWSEDWKKTARESCQRCVGMDRCTNGLEDD